MEAVYIFLYSELENDFDYRLVKACQHYSTVELKGGLNPHRGLKLYSILATKENVELINALIQTDKDAAWKILKEKSLEVQHN